MTGILIRIGDGTVVYDVNGYVHTTFLADPVAVTKNGNPATIHELVEGDEVTVTGEPAISIEANGG